MTGKRDFAKLELLGKTQVTADGTALEAVRLEGDFTLPESYRAFAQEYGYGLLCGLLLIYIPMGDHPDSLMVRSAELKAMLEESVEEDLFEYEPDGSPELVHRLVPFGISENGHTLAWDPEQSTGRAENQIYVVGSKALAVRKGTSDLYDFIWGCTNERVRSMLGPGYSPLPATFKPLPAS